MSKIKKLIEKLQRTTEKQQEEAILKIIREDADWVVDLNRVQLLEGKDSTDSMLTEYKSKSYADYKAKLNPLRVTDLKLTGEFHESGILIADRFPIKIIFKDKKRAKLIKQYGEDIEGLSEESRDLLIARIKGRVQAYYRKLIKL